MSRRRSHHSFEDDYERIIDQHIRTREQQPRGIEYQDDSLSSINSDDDEAYPSTKTTKKETNYFPKHIKPAVKDKITDASSYQLSCTTSSKENKESKTDNTSERLGRLESMLEQLIKREVTSTSTTSTAPPVAAIKPEVIPITSNGESSSKSSSSEEFHLEPRKSSFTTSMWINHIQEVSIQNNWNEKKTIKYMVSLMSGVIKAWYNNLPDHKYTWPEWKILITKTFPDNVDFVTTLKRLVTRVKINDESMKNYYFSKSYLLEACKITGSDAVSCLIDGLNKQSVQELAKTHNFLTPEQLYSNFLLDLPEYSVDYQPTQSEISYEVESSEISKDAETEEGDEVESAEDLFNYEEVQEDEEEFGYGKRSRSREKISLSTKRTTVHSRLDKRFIKAPYIKHYNTMPLAAKICGKCGHRGHSAYNCRTRMFHCKVTKIQTIKNCCYYQKCAINSVTFEGFIDTGCNSFIVKTSVAKVLNLKIIESRERIEGYGRNNNVYALGRIKLGNVKIGSAVVEDLEAVVVEDCVQDVDVVIGQAFLNRRNVTMILRGDQLNIFSSSESEL